MPVIAPFLICVIVFTLWLWWRPRKNAPPCYPGALPLIGHGYQLFGNRKQLWIYLKKIFNYSLEKGGVLEIWIGTHSVYVLTDPDEILTVSNSCLNKAYFYEFAKEYLKNGLITSDASTWRSHRKYLDAAFSQKVLETFIDEMNTQTRGLVAHLNAHVDKEPFDVRQYLINHTLKTVSRTSLGLEVKDQTMIDHAYADALDNLINVYCERVQKVWMHLSCIYQRSSLRKREDYLLKIMNNIIDAVIVKRRSDLKKKESVECDTVKPGKFKPVLDQILQLVDEQHVFSDEEIREHLDTIVAAAYDTTSGTLTYILLAIGSHPEVQEKIFKEIQEVQPNKNEDITKYDLLKLEYVEAVIKEVLRLYSPMPGVARKIDKDVKLKNYTLRAGSTCIFSFYGVGHHPMWGRDVNEFKPERWFDVANFPTNPNAFGGFGIGRRNCIGKQFAMLVMKLAVVYIVQNYHLYSDISKLESEYDIVLKPVSGHLISLKHRS
nr:cytochrome CYP340AB1 [Spodoptera frugiperda]